MRTIDEQRRQRGTARIILTGKGGYTGTETQTFTIVPAKASEKKTQTLAVTKSYSKAYGSKPFQVMVKLKKGNGTLTFTSSNKKVAAVNKNSGKVSIKGTGAAIITVKVGASAEYMEAKAEILIKVSPAKQKTLTVYAPIKMPGWEERQKNCTAHGAAGKALQ